MSDVSPQKSNTSKHRSPKKAAPQMPDAKDLLYGISEKDVEIEHLKTVIVGLEEKVKVLESVREDLQIERTRYLESEAAREALRE